MDGKVRVKFYRKILPKTLMKIFKSHMGYYFTLDDLLIKMVQSTPPQILKDEEFIKKLLSIALKIEITRSIRALRKERFAVISSAKRGRGYVYPDPNSIKSAELWASKFLANQRFRKQIPKQEKINDRKVFVEWLKQVKNPKIRKKAIAIAEKYKIKVPAEMI